MDLSKVIALASRIDQLDYYQVLGIRQEAELRDIRSAYHRRAKSIHPDLFFEHPNEEFRYAIDKIFKRVAEAYVVLRDEKKREVYDRGLSGDEKKLRYTDEDEQALRQERKDETGKTAQGRKLYQEAQRLHKDGDLKKARQTLRMALGFEGDNAHFQQLLEDWKREKSQ